MYMCYWQCHGVVSSNFGTFMSKLAKQPHGSCKAKGKSADHDKIIQPTCIASQFYHAG